VDVRVDGDCPLDEASDALRCEPLAGPTVLLVNPGRHDVLFRREAYAPRRRSVQLAPGTALDLKIALDDLRPPEPNPYAMPMTISWATTGLFLFGAGLTALASLSTPDDDPSRIDALRTTRNIAFVGAGLAA